MGNDRRNAVDLRIDRALALIRGMPLRWSDRDRGSAEEAVLSRGWFRGPDECARVLTSQVPLVRREGRGFGTKWPILGTGAWTLAPAMPVAVSGETAVGVDGDYRCDSVGVWREAGGAENLFLTLELSRPAPGASFDLLWFGDFERFVVCDGTLAIEDLFGTLRIPARPQLLDQLLVRTQRVDAGVLADVPMVDRRGPQTVEVQRPEELSPDDRWRDASIFLNARADIEAATRQGETLEAQLACGATVIFQHEEDEDGWLLKLREGSYVLSQIRAVRRAGVLSLCAIANSEIDAMAPGMRGRLVFDLRADLVTLGSP